MNEKAAFQYLKSIGCCDGCGLRYLGVKNHNAYENLQEYVAKYSEEGPDLSKSTTDSNQDSSQTNVESHTSIDCIQTAKDSKEEAQIKNSNGDTEAPPAKRKKWQVCVSCIGVLQTETWAECYENVRDVIEKKQYECETFACGLSAPIATMLREKAIGLLMKDKFPDYNDSVPTPLKEAWKWSFAVQLAKEINKVLDSGAFSPLLITLNLEYADDLEELEPLKRLAPNIFESRSRQKKKFTVEMTRRSVHDALMKLTLSDLKKVWPNVLPPSGSGVQCVSAAAAHAPVYLGGRYIKLSRELCQTPWVLNGVRMMESSVQEIIFGPVAELYGISPEASEHRLKFLSAGREDVDVRCLGNGRPFAIEVSDPRREPTEQELNKICEEISKDGRVVVKKLQVVSKNDLTLLKQGEETKFKTYNALCIKLTHSKHDLDNGVTSQTPVVTETDIENINTYNNTDGDARICIVQKTPIRVLHRRPLLERKRKVVELSAGLVSGHPQLFTIRIVTEAGTYIKEFVHSELKRSTPSLRDAIKANVDILALDVAEVHLDWPEKK